VRRLVLYQRIYQLQPGHQPGVTTVNQPYSASAAAKSPDSYPQNSEHHGIALSGDRSKICNV
jgi:hypothetical protein